MRTCVGVARLSWGCAVSAAFSPALGCGGSPIASPLVVADVAPEPKTTAPSEPELDAPFDAVGDPAFYLTDDFGEREHRRALMKRVGDLYWQLEAAEGGYVDLPGKPEAAFGRAEVVVAERHARHLRVVRASRGLRATFYLATADFHDVAARRVTLLTPGGEPFADGCGVTIPPGTTLQARAPKVGYRRVVFRRPWIAADGVLPERDVDVVFRVEPPRVDEPEGEPCEIRAPFEVYDRPGGRLVAKLVDDVLHFCTKVGAPRGGVVRIAFSHHDVFVTGYALSELVEERDPPDLGDVGTVGYGAGGGWGASHTTFLFLSPGDAIFTPESRLRVGTVVEKDFRVGDEGEEEGFRRVRFPFQQWGFTVMSIDAETAAAARKEL